MRHPGLCQWWLGVGVVGRNSVPSTASSASRRRLLVHLWWTPRASQMSVHTADSASPTPRDGDAMRSNDKKRPRGDAEDGPSSEQFHLHWNGHRGNLTDVFDHLLQSGSFVDVTLACDGQSIQAHKMVLSACSPYFQGLFLENPCQHPVVIMPGVGWPELKAVVEFMYRGEVNVTREQIGPLLRVAEFLEIRGLAEVNKDVASSLLQKELSSTDGSSAPKRQLFSSDDLPKRNSVSSTLKTFPTVVPLVTHGEIKTGIVEKRVERLSSTDGSSAPKRQLFSSDDLPKRNSVSSTLKTFPTVVPLVTHGEIKPGIVEKRVERLSSDDKGRPSTLADCQIRCKSTWSHRQLQLAITSVVTQKMRFTEASKKFDIPKGTLYDNILGKTNRMDVLEEAGLTVAEERKVIQFCCDMESSPHNKRTKKPLDAILCCVQELRRMRDPTFTFTGLAGFRWWWAFCKKHSIVSLYFNRS